MTMQNDVLDERFDYDAFTTAVRTDRGSIRAIASDLHISRQSLYDLLNRVYTPSRETCVRLKARYGDDFWRSLSENTDTQR